MNTDQSVNKKSLSLNSELQQELNGFLSERFNHNLKAFQKYLPELASVFENYTPKKKLDFCCGSNGIPNLFLSEEKSLFYKTDDPVSFCKNMILSLLRDAPFNISNYKYQEDDIGQIYDQYLNEALTKLNHFSPQKLKVKDLDIIPLALVAGVGLGYELGELYERVDVENLIIVENDPDIFYASMHTFDWSNLLGYIFSGNHSIDIIIDYDPQSCLNAINQIIESKGMYLGCSLFLVMHYLNDFIREFATVIHDNFGMNNNLTGFFDDYLFGMSHAYYALSHQKHWVISQKTDLSLDDYPVFVIGAGPSLDHDIEFIKQHQNKAIIVACGTSIDILYNTGIKPDFFACTERTADLGEVVSSFSDKSFIRNIILLCSEVCPPSILDSFEKTMIFGKANEPLYPYLKKSYLPFSDTKKIEYMNPLVGNIGISSVLHLGFKKIFLFGIDCGKKDTTKIHSKYSVFYINNPKIEEHSLYKMTNESSGNFGETCLTNSLYRI